MDFTVSTTPKTSGKGSPVQTSNENITVKIEIPTNTDLIKALLETKVLDGLDKDVKPTLSSMNYPTFIKIQVMAPLCIASKNNVSSTNKGNAVETTENLLKSELVMNDHLPATGDSIVSNIHNLLPDNGMKSSMIETTNLSSYKNCFIFVNSHTSSYDCHNCAFVTRNVKDAVLHFVNNGSENISTCILEYNKGSLGFACNMCHFTTIYNENAAHHWQVHLDKISLKCFICSTVTKDDCLLKLHLIHHLNNGDLIDYNKVADKISNCRNTNTRSKNKTKHFYCFKCNRNELSMQLLSQHYFNTHAQKRYACGVCKEQFHFVQDVKVHIKKHENAERMQDIVEQGNNLRTDTELHMTEIQNEDFEHTAGISQNSAGHKFDRTESFHEMKTSPKEKQNTSELAFKCSYCSFSTVLKKHHKEHVRKEHSDIGKYSICNICKKQFATKRNLKRHVRVIHGSKMFKCPECDFETKYLKNLSDHRILHTREFSQLCYICGLQGVHEKNMNEHIYKHSGIRHLACDLCSFRSSTRSGLSKHYEMHNERQYSCSHCKYRTHSKVYLNHHKQTHLDIKPFACYVCQHNSISKGSLIKHFRIHSTARKCFYCYECGKEYINKQTLKVHELSHTENKAYSCNICTARLISKRGLDAHLKLHTDEGRRYCFECGYSSCHKANFMKHVNKTCAKARHANENQMQCYRCGYASNHRSNFIHHMNKGCHKLKKSTLATKRKLA